LRYRSAKKEKEYVERRKLVVRLLEEKPWCEACPVFAEHDEKKINHPTCMNSNDAPRAVQF
jgi:hypothetical protein